MRVLGVLVAGLVLAGCASPSAQPSEAGPQESPAPSASTTGPTGPTTSRSPTSPAAPTSAAPPPAAPTRPADPRWQFFTTDRTAYASPWFAGRHRVMIPFGCTPAPFYDPDPGCPDDQGFHHGVDVAIPCGTPLRAGRAATVLDHGALGPAYGTNPVLLRVALPDGPHDVVVGHTLRVYVDPGDRVPAGRVFARVGDSAAPDGCHLHFEVRPAGGDYTSAVDPLPLLALR